MRERGDVALAPGVCELEDVLAVVLVDALAELTPERESRSSLSMPAKLGTIFPRSSTAVQAERMAPTPPRANFSSQLMRVCEPAPS